jgi:hypothetical protein
MTGTLLLVLVDAFPGVSIHDNEDGRIVMACMVVTEISLWFLHLGYSQRTAI